MDFVIIVLGVLYLCGKNVGNALAICSIIEGSLVFIRAFVETFNKYKKF